MNMKKGVICFLIVAMLTLSVPNITSAPASKQTSVTHSSFAMDA